jgi:hypothetical protein
MAFQIGFRRLCVNVQDPSLPFSICSMQCATHRVHSSHSDYHVVAALCNSAINLVLGKEGIAMRREGGVDWSRGGYCFGATSNHASCRVSEV